MKRSTILRFGQVFAGFRIIERMDKKHCDTRQVYLGFGDGGIRSILVVFDISGLEGCGAGKTACECVGEIALCSSLQHKAFPKVLASGVDKSGKRRVAWMAQVYTDWKSLEDEIRERKVIGIAECAALCMQLAEALDELASRTGGGGHYNLSADNVLVDFSNGSEPGVRIVGMARAGGCHKGNAPWTDCGMDGRFRAPETLKGSYSWKADAYSLSMLALHMLVGFEGDEEIQLGGMAPAPGRAVSPKKYHQQIWNRANGLLSPAPQLILKKATSLDPSKRFNTHQQLGSFIQSAASISLKDIGAVGASAESKPLQKAGPLKSGGLAMASEEKRAKESGAATQGRGLDDVAGMEPLKAMLRRNFVSIVRNADMARHYGITPPNGILLYGAPGCGKTFIAEKVAQESGLDYKLVNPSDFGSIYIHGAQGKIAEAFSEAQRKAPIILILDEFDAMAPRRDGEKQQANEVNELLTQLNNCASRGIYVLALTNRPDIIDPAVLRAGRLDEKYYVGLPDAQARKEIFGLELRKRPCAGEIDLERLSQATADFTCSDISYIVKEAARRCFDETVRSGAGTPVPLTMESLLEVAKSVVPSVSPMDMRRYEELRQKMEHRDAQSRPAPRVGFSAPA